MKLLGSFIVRKPLLISLVFLVASIAVVTGAANMRLASGNETLMNTSSRVYQDNRKLEQNFGGESIIILNTSESANGILTVANLKRMKSLETSLQQYDEIYSFISPVSMIEQLAAKQSGRMPEEQAMLDRMLYDGGKLRPLFNELILDDKHSVIMIKLKGNASDTEKENIANSVKDQLEREPFEGAATIVTGKPVLDSAVHASMRESMQRMILIAVALMIVVLLFVFPVRWRILPIPIILLSVITTLGFMGYIGLPMTMVSMAVFPILIGLGVDYAIQFQNRYEEELAKEVSANA